MFVEGEFHIIGGSRNRKHIVRTLYSQNDDDDNNNDDQKSNEFRDIFEFEDWVKGVQNCGLLYCRSKNEFILWVDIINIVIINILIWYGYMI